MTRRESGFAKKGSTRTKCQVAGMTEHDNEEGARRMGNGLGKRPESETERISRRSGIISSEKNTRDRAKDVLKFT